MTEGVCVTSYNKLVRDRVVDKIIRNGGIPRYRQLGYAEFRDKLPHKLCEEAAEVQRAKTLDELTRELGDMEEVMHSCSQAHLIFWEVFRSRRLEFPGKIARLNALSQEAVRDELVVKACEIAAECTPHGVLVKLPHLHNVMHAVACVHGVEWNRVEFARFCKSKQFGAFRERIFLQTVETNGAANAAGAQ